MTNPQITNEQIVAIARRNGGEIAVNLQWRNDQFRRRLKRMARKGFFLYKHKPSVDIFYLNSLK